MTKLSVMSGDQLEIREAVLLGHALVDRLAREANIRCLAIKGPLTVAQGLRPGHDSIDVDVLVEPRGVGRLADAASARGWTVRAAASVAQVLPYHSVELRHPLWPCEVDMHRFVPGAFASPDVVFDRHWESRVLWEVAGVEVFATDPVTSTVISALHLLRDHPARAAELDDLVRRAGRRLTSGQRLATLELARQIGAEETLAPFFGALLPEQQLLHVDLPELRGWRVRQQSTELGSTASWLWELGNAKGLDRGRVLWRAMFLGRSELLQQDPDAATGFVGLAHAHARRWVRGLSRLPRAIVILRRNRRREGSHDKGGRWMRRRVLTLSPADLTRTADRLLALVATDGFHPDAVVGIETGGVRVVEAMSSPSGAVMSCRLRRPSTQAKERSVVEKTLRRLPYAISDRARLLEDTLLARKPATPVEPTPELLAQVAVIAKRVEGEALRRVLVVDDAVDSGATLATVMRALRSALPAGVEVRSGVLTQTRAAHLVAELPDYAVHQLVLLRFPWSFDYRGVR